MLGRRDHWSDRRRPVASPLVRLRSGLGIRTAVSAACAAGLLLASAGPAFAAGPGGRGGGGGGHGGGGGSTTTGNDVSYPQCGASLPSSPAFGIVGVNGGIANDLNPCLGPTSSYGSYAQSELYWAVARATGTTTQPKASLYVNTGDPGNLYNGSAIADWPTSSSAEDPYAACTTTTVTTSSGPAVVGADSPGCAWQYGYQRAVQDRTWLTQEAEAVTAQESAVAVASQPSAYVWWLDVETGNSWQSGTAGLQMNVADLQGMVQALRDAGVSGTSAVGVYSTTYQWTTITGGSNGSAGATLAGMPDWLPGATTQTGAVANCSATGFTGGKVVLTQWTARSLDSDYACP